MTCIQFILYIVNCMLPFIRFSLYFGLITEESVIQQPPTLSDPEVALRWNRNRTASSNEEDGTEISTWNAVAPNSVPEPHIQSGTDELASARIIPPHCTFSDHNVLTWWTRTQTAPSEVEDLPELHDNASASSPPAQPRPDLQLPAPLQANIDALALLERSRPTPRQADEAPSYDAVMGRQGWQTCSVSIPQPALPDIQEVEQARLQREDSELPSYDEVMEQSLPTSRSVSTVTSNSI